MQKWRELKDYYKELVNGDRKPSGCAAGESPASGQYYHRISFLRDLVINPKYVVHFWYAFLRILLLDILKTYSKKLHFAIIKTFCFRTASNMSDSTSQQEKPCEVSVSPCPSSPSTADS